MIFRQDPPQRTQAFFGQMSAVFFFAAPIPKHEDVAAIFSLGPNFTPNIDTYESKVVIGQQGSSFYLDGKRTLKIQLCYNPKAIYSINRCLETASEDLKLYAKKLPGTSIVRTHGIKETLYCTGGIRVLLPLFRTLDQPKMVEYFFKGSIQDTSVDSKRVDPMFALQVFSLLQNMLLNNPQNQQQMVLAHGFQVIGFLLESINPQCWTRATVDAFEKLASAVSRYEPLYRQLFASICLNLRIWIFTDPEVQMGMFDLVGKHVKRHPVYFRDLITVQTLVDILRMYYWFSAEGYSQATQPIVDPVTFETMGRRPNHTSIKQLRITILQLARVLAVDGFTFDETRALVYYLQDCHDPEQGVDVLQMLLALLTAPNRATMKNDVA